MKIITISIFLIALACTPVQAQGVQTVYVSPVGDNSNPGTLTQPLQNLSHALSLHPAVIVLRGGVYTEEITIRQTVTVKAFAGEQVVIRPNSGTFGLRVAYEAEGVVLQGLEIDAINVSNAALKVTSGAHDVQIIDCHVYNSKRHGILISDRAYNVYVRGGSVHDNGGYIDQFQSNNYHGIYPSGVDGVVIDGVEIYHSGGHGVHIYGSCLDCVTIVKNSYIHDNPTGIGAYYGNVYILDNRFDYVGTYGIRLQYALLQSAYVSGNEISHPNPGWTALYVTNLDGVVTIEGNYIHDSYFGFWMRNGGTGTVFLTSNVLQATKPVLVHATTITLVENDNEK